MSDSSSNTITYTPPSPKNYSTSVSNDSKLNCEKAEIELTPCNLISLKVIEHNAKPEGVAGTRHAVFGASWSALARATSPTRLPSGHTFQVTAHSSVNKPRRLEFIPKYDGSCAKGEHHAVSIDGNNSILASYPLSVHRKEGFSTLSTDSFTRQTMGLAALLNLFYLNLQAPARYFINATSCGYPTSNLQAPMDSLEAVIEVYPADKFELKIELPALFQPKSLSYEKKNKGWETSADREKAQEEEDVETLYSVISEMDASSTKAEAREFYNDLKSQGSDAPDPSLLAETKATFKQIDGSVETKFPISDITNLVNAMRDAEKALKAINKWVKNAQVGPGVSFSVECQFLIGELSAEWGYMEAIDDRVFLGYKGQISLKIFTITANISLGFRAAGAADLLVVIEGEGTLSLNGSAERKRIDSPWPEVKLEPEGEAKITGKIEGTLFWIVKAGAAISCSVKATADELRFLQKDCLLGGKIQLSRAPTVATFTVEGRFWGETVYKYTVVEGAPDIGKFSFF